MPKARPASAAKKPPGRVAPTAAASPTSSPIDARSRAPDTLPPVAGIDVSPGDLARFLRANAPGARASAVAKSGAKLGVERAAKESPQDFELRVSRAAERAGRLGEFRANLAEEQSLFEQESVFRLLAHRSITAELARRGIPVDSASSEVLDASFAVLRAVLARDAGLAPESEEARAHTVLWVTDAVNAALFEPHREIFERTLSHFEAGKQTALLGALYGLYAPEHRAGVFAAIAADLERGGPAAQLTILAAQTGRLAFTAADFDELAQRAPAAAPPRVAAQVTDPIERALTPVSVELSQGQLSTRAERTDFLDQLRAGGIRVKRQEGASTEESGGLVVLGADGQPHSDTASREVLRAELEGAAAVVAERVDFARPKAVEQLAREAGLGLWVDRLGTDWLTGSEAMRESVQALAVRTGLEGSGQPQALAATLAALGLPDAASRTALEVEHRTRMLQALRALPPEFIQVVKGEGRLSLPLAPGAPLDAVQARTVAALQTYLVSIGGIEPPARPGELDEATVQMLRDLSEDPWASSVEFDQALATKALAGLVALSPPRQLLLAEAILGHPGVRAVLRAAPELHAVDAALAYLRAAGEEGIQPSALDSGRLAEVLDRTAQRPPSPAAVERAVREARTAPFSREARARLLAGRAFVISAGATRVFRAGPPLEERESSALARRLAGYALPQRTLSISRGGWSASLIDKAPVVALRLAAASLADTIDPSTVGKEVREALAAVRRSIGASGEVSGVLDDQLLTVLAASVLASGSPGTTERGLTWARVIAAVKEGRVVLADLEPLPEKGALDRDVNTVLGELRGLLPTLRDTFLPSDSATAAEEHQRAPSRPLSSDGDAVQLSRARGVIATATGERPPDGDGPLTRKDFEHLETFVGKLTEETPRAGGTERDYSARSFLEDWKLAAPMVEGVAEAVGRGELRLEGTSVRARQRDALLEAQGEAAARLLLRAADLRLDRDRHRNEDLAGDAKRMAAAAPHQLRLPELAEPSTPGLDRATPLLQLKAQQRSEQGAPPLGLPRWLRDAREELNAQSLEALMAQMTPQGASPTPDRGVPDGTARPQHTIDADERASLQLLLETLRSGQQEPFKLLEQPIPHGDARGAEFLQTALLQTARAVLTRALDAEAKALQGVDRSNIEFLLEKHPDALGQGVLAAALMGAPERPLETSVTAGDPRAKSESRTELLRRLATQMGDGPGWSTVNPLPSDDPDTAVGKRALRRALEQLAAAGGAGPFGLPAREVSAAKTLLHDAVGLTPSRAATDLRGALVLSGLLDSAEAGAFDDDRLSPRVLEQTARLASSLAERLRAAEPRLAERLEVAAGRLAAGSARGPHTLKFDSSTDPIDKAVRLVVEVATNEETNESQRPRSVVPLDLQKELPPVESLTVTGPIGNRVLDSPPEGGLGGVAARAGTRAAPEDVARAEREARNRVARFEGEHFVLATGAKLANYLALLPILIPYELSARPESQLVQAGASAATADAPEELDAASDTVGETVKDVAALQLGLFSFKTRTGLADEVIQLWDDGRHDEAAAAAVATAVMAPALVRDTIGATRRVAAWARRNEAMAVEGSPTRSLAVPVETKPAAEAPGLGRRAAASAVDLTVRGLSNLRHPVEPLVKAPARAVRGGVAAALRAVGLPTGIRFDGIEPSFEYRLTGEQRLEIVRNPDTRIRLPLRGLRGVETIELSGHQLMRLGQLESPRIDPDFARELGIDGAKLKRHLRALFDMTRGLPAPSVDASLVPEFKRLVDPERIRDVHRWSTPGIPDADGGVELKNATLAKLLGALRDRRPGAFTKALLEHGRELGLEDKLDPKLQQVEAQVRAVLANYSHVPDKEVASAARRARILDARSPAPAASAGKSVVVSAPGAPGGAATSGVGGTPGAPPATGSTAASGTGGAPPPTTAGAPGAPPATGSTAASGSGGPLTPATTGALGGASPPPASDTPSEAGRASDTRTLVPPIAPFAAGAAPDPMLAAVERFVDDAAKRYGTRWPTDARALAAIEWTHQNFRSAIAEAPPGSLEAALIRARFEKWRATVGAYLGGQFNETNLTTAAGRARLHALRAEIWQTELAQRPLGERLVAGATDVAKGTGSLLASSLKGPAVWGTLALGLPHTLRELGDIYGDPLDPSTPLEKHARAAATLAAPVATGAAVGAGLSLATRLVPEVARLGPAMLRVGVAGVVTQGPDLVARALSAYGGELNAAEAVQALAAIGLPEASFYKVDPERYPNPFGVYDVTNDRGLLESDTGGVPSPRHDYVAGRPATPKPWWRSGEPDPKPPAPTTLLRRLVQLLPPERRPDPGAPLSTALLRRPQDLRLDQVRSYEEPPFPTWQFLRRLETLGQKTPALRSARAAQGFDFARWQSEIRGRVDRLLTPNEDPDGGLTFTLGPDGLEGLTTLFAENDFAEALNPAQRTVVERRRKDSVEAVLRWVEVLNALGIGADEKRAALGQFLENMVANHRANAIMFEVLGADRKLDAGSWTRVLSRDANADDYFVGVMNFQ